MQIDVCLKTLINLASNPTNLPAFNSYYCKSDVIVTVLPLTYGECPELALRSKMLLGLLNPLLDSEQLGALKLVKDEASTCVSLLQIALKDVHHMAEDFSLLAILNALIWFTHEYHRQSKISGSKATSGFESKLVSVSQEIRCNIELLVEQGILSAVKDMLKLRGEEELQYTVAAAKLVWCLAHDTATKTKMVNDSEMIECLQEASKLLSPTVELKLTCHCALLLLGMATDGRFYVMCVIIYCNFL